MTMKQRVALLSLLALSIALVAVAASDLSGTWILDKAKSDPIRMGRGGDAGGPPPDFNVTLIINQTANDVSISRTMSGPRGDRTSEQKFSLDGKESTNPSAMGRGEFKGKAKFEGANLIIEGTQKVNTPNGEFDIGVRDEYALSSDGKVLTLTTTRSTPQGDRTSKQVFNKK